MGSETVGRRRETAQQLRRTEYSARRGDPPVPLDPRGRASISRPYSLRPRTPGIWPYRLPGPRSIWYATSTARPFPRRHTGRTCDKQQGSGGTPSGRTASVRSACATLSWVDTRPRRPFGLRLRLFLPRASCRFSSARVEDGASTFAVGVPSPCSSRSSMRRFSSSMRRFAASSLPHRSATRSTSRSALIRPSLRSCLSVSMGSIPHRF